MMQMTTGNAHRCRHRGTNTDAVDRSIGQIEAAHGDLKLMKRTRAGVGGYLLQSLPRIETELPDHGVSGGQD